MVAGSRSVPWLFTRVARLRSRELFTLTVLVLAVSVATASYIVFGASKALGADLAGRLGWLTDGGRNALVAGSIISISANPLVRRWLSRRTNHRGIAEIAHFSPPPSTPNSSTAIVVGHGPAGQTVARTLRDCAVTPVIVESNIDTVSEINAAGGCALFGDATRREILEAAGLRSAQ